MARLSVQEEQKFLVLKYVIGLSLHIQQEMEFLTVSMLAHSFHYANKLEAKQKGKARFTKNPTGRKPDKKSPAESDKFKNPSQLTPPNIDQHKNKFQKDKKDCNKQDPTGKWCDYHNSAWNDTLECKARKTFLENFSTFDSSDKTLVESNPDASALLDLTLTTPTSLTIANEKE